MSRLILFLLIVIGCSTPVDVEQINKFKSNLDLDKVSAIDKAVLVLDSLVSTKYKTGDLISDYECFLNSIAKDQFDDESFYKSGSILNLNKQFKESGLWDEVFFSFDTAYIQNGLLITRYSNKNSDISPGEYSVERCELSRDMRKSVISIDSLINEKKRILEYNTSGKYFGALRLIQESDSLIINYLELKDAAGSMSTAIIAGFFLYNEADLDDYFTKRILAIELLMWE